MSEKQTGADKKRKAPKTAFKPGQSGNPKGKEPNAFSLGRFVRSHLEANEEANLKAIMAGLTQKAIEGNVEAAKELFTRGYGKPVETVKLEQAEQVAPPESLAAWYTISADTSRTDSPQN